MITITLNGEPHAVETGHTAADLVETLTGVRVNGEGRVPEGAALGVALARNGSVVPRRTWSAATLDSGDTIEIVRATQGG